MLLAGSTAVAATVSTTQAPWTQFQGNAAHSGVQPGETTLNTQNVSSLRLSSFVGTGDDPLWSSPVVANGSVYYTANSAGLVVFPQTGCHNCFPTWRGVVGAQAIAAPAVVNGLAYVASQASRFDNHGRLNVFNANGCGSINCQPLWQGVLSETPDRSSPAIAHGVVYVGDDDGNLYAFRAKGCGHPLCHPMWTAQLGSPVLSSPAVADGLVYAVSFDGILAAFPAAGCGAATCQPVWSAQLRRRIVLASPSVAGGRVFMTDGHTLNVFAAKGCGAAVCEPLWRGPAHVSDGTPAISGGIVYVNAEPNPQARARVGALEAFDVRGCGQSFCRPLWTGINFTAGGESSPVVANGVVYIGKSPATANTGDAAVLSYPAAGCGKPFCLPLGAAQTGPEQFYLQSTPAVVDGRVYIASKDSINGGSGVYIFSLPKR
jgi:outer membrane protein assembly factor BamB